MRNNTARKYKTLQMSHEMSETFNEAFPRFQKYISAYENGVEEKLTTSDICCCALSVYLRFEF